MRGRGLLRLVEPTVAAARQAEAAAAGAGPLSALLARTAAEEASTSGRTALGTAAVATAAPVGEGRRGFAAGPRPSRDRHHSDRQRSSTAFNARPARGPRPWHLQSAKRAPLSPELEGEPLPPHPGLAEQAAGIQRPRFLIEREKRLQQQQQQQQQLAAAAHGGTAALPPPDWAPPGAPPHRGGRGDRGAPWAGRAGGSAERWPSSRGAPWAERAGGSAERWGGGRGAPWTERAGGSAERWGGGRGAPWTERARGSAERWGHDRGGPGGRPVNGAAPRWGGRGARGGHEWQERQPAARLAEQQEPAPPETIVVPEDVTLLRLAALLGVEPPQLEAVLADLGDRPQSFEDLVSPDSAELAALELGKLAVVQGSESADADAQPRPAVVTVMGHVDHGKTTLLDALRSTAVAAGEAGGITQHIGAFEVCMPGSGASLTFLDTPGHAAFSAMRARGAAATDLAVLVVAADDGVMPQTLEAIAHARAAGKSAARLCVCQVCCPIVVAITKCDAPNADPARVRRQLLGRGLELEEAGGSVQARAGGGRGGRAVAAVVEVAAPKGIGLDALEEALLLQAELLELRASRSRRAAGVVVEARLDKGQGPVATVIVKRGMLRVGQAVVVGAEWGKVRSLRGTGGGGVAAALPGQPVEIAGLRGLPHAGDELMGVGSEARVACATAPWPSVGGRAPPPLTRAVCRRRARTANAEYVRRARAAPAAGGAEGQRTLPLIIKADVQGSAEAVRDAVAGLSGEHVAVQVVHLGVGPISISDVQLAIPLGAKILGFNVRTAGADVDAQAKQKGLDIRCQRVIYHLLEDVGDLITGAAPKVEHEVVNGTAEVLQVFSLKGGRGKEASAVAGCRVTEGSLKAGARYRVLRGGEVVHEGACASLRRHKLDVETVGKGTECGVALEGGFAPALGDVLQARGGAWHRGACTTCERALLGGRSADANVRNQAEGSLKQLQDSQHDAFLLALAAELANQEKPVDARRLAGLILKNTLDAKDEARKIALVQQWTAMEAGAKQQIKQALLHTLATPGDVGHTAALVVAKAAAIEVPRGEWPELIAALLANVGVQPPNSALKQATLEALGYTCEELGALEEDYLQQEQVNSILTAVVQGMRGTEPDPDVRQAATVALYNALEFAHSNFGNGAERNYIMQIVCEGTLADHPRIRQASWECLVRVAALYYDKLPTYMQDIFALTQRAVKQDEEEVALQALEFWCTVCEEELDRGGEAGEADSESINHRFIQAALPHLVPLLLEQLTKQEEGQEAEDGSWNLAMAAGSCLGLCASAAGDAIVPLVMPYVQANIQKQDGAESWRYREAATFAFGSILEGPSAPTLGQLVHSGLGFLLAALKDPNPQVKNTTAWTIGRIFEFVHGADATPPLIGPQNLPAIIQALLESIRDAPHIAEKARPLSRAFVEGKAGLLRCVEAGLEGGVCYAISQLAAGFSEAGGSSPMSPYFKDVAARPADLSEQIRLQTQARAVDGGRACPWGGEVEAFEAINDVVQSSAADTVPMVVQLIPLMIGKLNETLHMPAATAEAAEKQSELKGLLCGVIQVIVRKLTESDAAKAGVLQYADHIMEALLAVSSCRGGAGVHQDALLAVVRGARGGGDSPGAMTYACGRQFSKYMEHTFPDWQVCQVTVGALGDVARAIERDIFPYCDRIMLVLLHNLQSNDVHRNIKPQILSCFGDLALAIGDNFEVYLAHVVQMLQSAMALSVQQARAGRRGRAARVPRRAALRSRTPAPAGAPPSVEASAGRDDEDIVDYNNMLRLGILEAWAGMFNGLTREKARAPAARASANQYLQPYAVPLVDFIESIYTDKQGEDKGVWKACVALLGDMAAAISGVGALFQQRAFVRQLLQAAAMDPAMQDTAAWATQVIAKNARGA
eukprot:scaffold2.g6846.t1